MGRIYNPFLVGTGSRGIAIDWLWQQSDQTQGGLVARGALATLTTGWPLHFQEKPLCRGVWFRVPGGDLSLLGGTKGIGGLTRFSEAERNLPWKPLI